MRSYRHLTALSLLATLVPACAAMPMGGAKESAPASMAPLPAPRMAMADAEADDALGTEEFTDYGVNPPTDPAKDPLSTFAIDVDTGSYAIARNTLQGGGVPAFASVRAEEFLNYFDYGYEGPTDGRPFAVHLHAAPSPYESGHHVLRIGLQAKRVSRANRAPIHLVYLVDTSGSMHAADKLGLAKKSLRLLTRTLKPTDTVALCTYAGSTRVILPPTAGSEQGAILAAIDGLTSGGGTAMSDGMEMAYELAARTHVEGHVSRVVVLSDGDANIGRASHEEILQRIGHFKETGITLSTVGFGRGNYKDTMMEQLANRGDGNYAYVDTEAEARRAFGEQVGGMLEVVAKDVKVQVEFDPAVVQRYRLIGYENRDVADRDFRNDQVDAGEIGAGHDVTALYDLVLKPGATGSPVVVRLRHKEPRGAQASEMQVSLRAEDMSASFAEAPASFRLATGVVGFAEVLRQSPYAKGWTLGTVQEIVDGAASSRREQRELSNLIRVARSRVPSSSPAVVAN